eukprot:CAMPEP_0184651206 /NCGR_PEP_ID=MMETSP0308-20130426/8792_1 /TAXON_ID=38269 /ORGANISM="Gloeochaete witrockiana, Strain SAG 46.84" /LENGTH=1117 /DNA_ID=CAMNT_0027085261 /DNA_START=44 /DNA_END=3397 /DNA_ORIENTATION=+
MKGTLLASEETWASEKNGTIHPLSQQVHATDNSREDKCLRLFANAHEQYNAGDYGAAACTCQQIRKLHPAWKDPLLLEGAALFQMGKFEEALHLNQRAIQLDPLFAEAIGNMGNCLRFMGDLDGAMECFKRALSLKPTFFDAHTNMAGVLSSRGRVMEAVQHLQAALAMNPDLNEARCNLGQMFSVLGLREEAKTCFSEAIRRKPDMVPAYVGLAHVLHKEGHLDHALVYFQQAVLLNPRLVDELHSMGNIYTELRRPREAVACFQEAIKLRPDHAMAFACMGGIYLEHGEIPHAISLYKRALSADPKLADVHNNLGNAYKSAGLLDDAIAAYKNALAIDPRHASAYNNLGNSLKDRNQPSEALVCYKAALAICPRFAAVHSNLANFLQENGRMAEAFWHYRMAISIDPTFADVHSNLGNAYKACGMIQEAIQCYCEAIRLNPSFSDAHSNLGSALKDAGRVDEAIFYYRRALQYKPYFPDALANLVHSLQMVCDWRERSEHTEQLMTVVQKQIKAGHVPSVQPHHALFYPIPWDVCLSIAVGHADKIRSNVLHLLPANGIPPTWPAIYDNVRCSPSSTSTSSSRPTTTAAAHAPESSSSSTPLWNNEPSSINSTNSDINYDVAPDKRRRGDLVPPVPPDTNSNSNNNNNNNNNINNTSPSSSSPSSSSHSSSSSDEDIYATAVPPSSPPPLSSSSSSPRDEQSCRLRVGYVSSDFCNHPLAHLMQSVFGMHDRSLVEVFCYAIAPDDGSEYRKKIASEAEHFVDVSALQYSAVAQRIREEDRIHVLINLNGYTAKARNEIFALRPAPLQILYMGFPGSMGAPGYIEYMIADQHVIPNKYAHRYTEKILHMPHSYFVNDHKQSCAYILKEPTTREAIGLPKDKFIFFNANQLWKIDPPTMDAWCQILSRVPNSVLWLLRFPAAGEMFFRSEARSRGLPDERIIFTDVAPKHEFIRRSSLADLFLDTPLCNGHTTGVDVLWAGVPMVTLPLQSMSSRVATSLVHAVRMPEMVVRSWDDYIELAVRLATTERHTTLKEWRERLAANRWTEPLFDTQRWVRELDKLLLNLWAERRGDLLATADAYTTAHPKATPCNTTVNASDNASVSSIHPQQQSVQVT